MTDQEFAQKCTDYCVLLVNVASNFKTTVGPDINAWAHNKERWTKMADQIVLHGEAVFPQLQSEAWYRMRCIAMLLNSCGCDRYLEIVMGLNYADAIIELLLESERSEILSKELDEKHSSLIELLDLLGKAAIDTDLKKNYQSKYLSIIQRLEGAFKHYEASRSNLIKLMIDLLFCAYGTGRMEETSSEQIMLRFGVERQQIGMRTDIVVNSNELRATLEARAQIADIWSEILANDACGDPNVMTAKSLCRQFADEAKESLAECANIEDVLELLGALKKAEDQEDSEEVKKDSTVTETAE